MHDEFYMSVIFASSGFLPVSIQCSAGGPDQTAGCNNRPVGPFSASTAMSTSENYVGLVLASVATGVLLVLARKRWTSRRIPYPPGPKGYPIIGNALGFPEGPVWEGLTKMAQEYSE